MDLSPYLDGYGLMSPRKLGQPKPLRSCDNGILYLSEYFLLKSEARQLEHGDVEWLHSTIYACMQNRGLLARAPDFNGDQEGPDDYYGVLAACSEFGFTEIAEDMLTHGFEHFGFYINGQFQWTAFQWRQPQMFTAMWLVSGLSPFLIFPFIWLTALIIATSCIGVDRGNTDARILTWCLIIATKRSWLCRQASRLFARRLLKHYPGGMKDVFNIYFGNGHPITQLSVDLPYLVK